MMNFLFCQRYQCYRDVCIFCLLFDWSQLRRRNCEVLHVDLLHIYLFDNLGLLDTLINMNMKLEEIQKSLDMYLETKRQIFPRFYFLSNDDLLEILGQSKNPDAVSTSAMNDGKKR